MAERLKVVFDKAACCGYDSVGFPSFGGPRPTEGGMWGPTPIDQAMCRIRFKEARFDGDVTPAVHRTLHPHMARLSRRHRFRRGVRRSAARSDDRQQQPGRYLQPSKRLTSRKAPCRTPSAIIMV